MEDNDQAAADAEALEKNYRRGIKACFTVLLENLAAGDADAAGRFYRCCATCRLAREIARKTCA